MHVGIYVIKIIWRCQCGRVSMERGCSGGAPTQGTRVPGLQGCHFLSLATVQAVREEAAAHQGCVHPDTFSRKQDKTLLR